MNSTRPLFMLLSTVLIVSGAAMALMFGWVGYHVIYAPQDVPVLNYVLGHMPTAAEAAVINGTIAGQPFTLALPQSVTICGLTFLMFISFGVLLGISRCLSGIGIQLFKVLAQTHREERPAAPPARRAKAPAPQPEQKPDPETPGGYQF